MQLHELKPKHKLKKRKRVGRGGKKGTYSGRGNKGQSARAGRKMVPIIRELIKRYPKLRGYKSFVLEDYTAVVNIDTLEKISKTGEVISPDSLIKKGIIRTIKGKAPKVKILGRGKLSKQLIIENCKVSKTAKEVIEKIGGTVK
ncbi:MAG: 50S ribosomal protein L15 [Candidatus Staskawiczbacteria bacterium]|nr:50S ribosomal protein L15 [Candidatus Staskawiczbacteria bacterium]